MKEILLHFVTDYSDPRTRPFAHAVASQYIEQYRDVLDVDQVKQLYESMLGFSERFRKAWPWNKSKVTADFLRSLN